MSSLIKLKKPFLYKKNLQILFIAFGFLAVIIIGAFLLSIPLANKDGNWRNFLDAAFTAVSAVCVTGLTVVDTTSSFSTFGHVVIIILIQTGGLGVMGLATLVFFAIRKKITLSDRLAMQQAVGDVPSSQIVRYIRNMVIITFAIEFLGAIALMPAFVFEFGANGIFKAVFISISSFCNAGFDILGGADNPLGSLTHYSGNISIMLSVSFLIVLGGIGFSVILDVLHYKKRNRLMLHSKIVLIATAVILCFSTLVFLIAEWNVSLADMNFGKKLLNAFFMAVTPRTAGYYSVNLNEMTLFSRFFTIILMFVGASPASTGGGIKTTTAVILLFVIFSGLKNQGKIVLDRRHISTRIIMRAVALTVVFSLIVIVITSGLMITQSFNLSLKAKGLYTLENMLFETVSGLCTVGLTLGITPMLSVSGKILIMIAMFLGRVGPLSIGLIFLKKINSNIEEKIRYPEAAIMIG